MFKIFDPKLIAFVQEEPYLMMKPEEKGVINEGNNRYEGYSKDLADLISNHLSISVELRLVKDNKYGGQDTGSPHGWNGMVGELIRHVSGQKCDEQREE